MMIWIRGGEDGYGKVEVARETW